MLKKDFDKWLVTRTADNALNGLKIYVISLKYLEDCLSLFVKHSEGDIREKNK